MSRTELVEKITSMVYGAEGRQHGLPAIRNGDLDRNLALERINCLIHTIKDADIRRFLKKMRWRIRVIAIKKAVTA